MVTQWWIQEVLFTLRATCCTSLPQASFQSVPGLLQSTPRISLIPMNLKFGFPQVFFFFCGVWWINAFICHWTCVCVRVQAERERERERGGRLEFCKHASISCWYRTTLTAITSMSQVTRHNGTLHSRSVANPYSGLKRGKKRVRREHSA
jgi:hypothetical protein